MSNRIKISRREALKVLSGLTAMFVDLPRTGAQATPFREQMLVLEDGTRIWYEKRYGGIGPTFVFVHGNGQNHTTGNDYLKRMEEIGHPVIVYDLPGHGKSEAYRDGQYSMQRFSATLSKLLTESGIEKPILVGHSLGGMIALQYAVEHPDKVKALVLTSTSDADPVKLNKSLSLDDLVSEIKRKAIESGGREQGKVYRFDKNPQLNDENVANISLTYTSPRALIGNLEATSGYDIHDRLRAINVPTLILRGENDAIMTAQMTEAMAKRIRGSRYITVYKAGHNFIFQKPQLFTGLVEANYGFINQQYRFK